MSQWSFYDPATGLFSRKKFEGPDSALDLNTPSGLAAIKGDFDPLCERVENGLVVAYQPPPPDDEHDWDPISRRWRKRPEIVQHELEQRLAREAIADIEAGQIRTIREALLGDETALQRLREQEPAIAAAREVLQRPRPSVKTSGRVPPASVEQPAE